MKTWDESHKERFEILSNKMKFHPRTDTHEWYFELDITNLYFDELAFMVEYLQAIGELRMKMNITTPRPDSF